MLCTPVFIFTSGSSALLGGVHVVVCRSACHHLPYSIHFSEFMSIFFTRKQTKHETIWSPHVGVCQSARHHLPYSIHFSEFMSIFFTIKRTKHTNIWSLPFSYDMKTATDGYQVRKALMPRASLTQFWPRVTYALLALCPLIILSLLIVPCANTNIIIFKVIIKSFFFF